VAVCLGWSNLYLERFPNVFVCAKRDLGAAISRVPRSFFAFEQSLKTTVKNMKNECLSMGMAAALIAIPFSVGARQSDGASLPSDYPSRVGPGPGTCGPGWRPVTPPLNPALGCLPHSFYLEPDPSGEPNSPPGECPEGWRPVTPPLNPMLVCLPDQLVDPSAPDPSAGRPDPFCPSHWKAVTPPLNPWLICLPDTIVGRLPPSDSLPPVRDCPEDWVPITPPLNPVLGCLPDTLKDPSSDDGLVD
jgi:hypothetical protein